MQIIDLLDGQSSKIGSLLISEDMATHLGKNGSLALVKSTSKTSGLYGVITKGADFTYNYYGAPIETVVEGSSHVRFTPALGYAEECVARINANFDSSQSFIDTFLRKALGPYRPVKRNDDNLTLTTELCNGEHWLVGIDKRGVTRYLAHFSNPADCATFTRAFALAKASAHASGQLGI